MISQGVNPHIINSSGESFYHRHPLSHLKNITPLKSVYFIVKQISNWIVGDPWRYSNGIYPATITDAIEEDGEGMVFDGKLDSGKKVTFKFARIGAVKVTKFVSTVMADLDTKLSKMSTTNPAAGSCVLEVLGYYRLVCY